jgi:hypothetical protein
MGDYPIRQLILRTRILVGWFSWELNPGVFGSSWLKASATWGDHFGWRPPWWGGGPCPLCHYALAFALQLRKSTENLSLLVVYRNRGYLKLLIYRNRGHRLMLWDAALRRVKVGTLIFTKCFTPSRFILLQQLFCHSKKPNFWKSYCLKGFIYWYFFSFILIFENFQVLQVVIAVTQTCYVPELGTK